MQGTANTLKLKELMTEMKDKRETEERQALEATINRTYRKERFGQRTDVKLLEVGKRDVRVVEGDRKDSYSLSIKEFTKFYTLVP
jgi:hypothetical protein